MQIFVCCESLKGRAGRSSDLDISYCGIQALRSRPKSPRSWMRKGKIVASRESLGQVRVTSSTKQLFVVFF